MNGIDEVARLVMAVAGGFVAGAVIVGSIVWADVAKQIKKWRTAFEEAERLRAQERLTRVGNLDTVPRGFHAPPLRVRTTREGMRQA